MEIETCRFRSPGTDALYTEYPTPAGLALRPELSEEEREALLLEARSYLQHGLTQTGRVFCRSPESLDRMHPRRVKALQLVVEEAKPAWVERIKLACMYDNTWSGILRHSRVPPYPALAILRNLIERGEVLEDLY